jgi:hypothetical protein
MLARFASPGPDGTWVAESDIAELKSDEEFQKELKKFDASAVSKYVHLKYAEALAAARAKNYQRGYDVSNALLVLEPRVAESEAVRRLRRHCEAMITQTTLVEARFLHGKAWYVEGEPVELRARMKNVFRSPLTLQYDAGTPAEPGGGLLVTEVSIQMQEMRGAGLVETKPLELRFEAEVPIAPGAQWERTFTIDPAVSIPDAEHIRVVTVNGWTQPVKILAEGTSFIRRVQFEPAKLRIVPRKYAALLERPLESLGKAMATGTAQEVFISSQMLEGADHEKGLRLLVDWMGRADTEVGRIAAAQILTAMSGQTLGTDPGRWAAWIAERDSGKKKGSK